MGLKQRSRRIIIRDLSSVVAEGSCRKLRQTVGKRHWSASVANRKARETKQRMIRSKQACIVSPREVFELEGSSANNEWPWQILRL
jgi:hypothetical protein